MPTETSEFIPYDKLYLWGDGHCFEIKGVVDMSMEDFLKNEYIKAKEIVELDEVVGSIKHLTELFEHWDSLVALKEEYDSEFDSL